MLLSELIIASARAGLALQADDGSMPAGHNGPYRDSQTPLRNTGHWISIWSNAHRSAGDGVFRDAALRALAYVEAEARKRPPGGNLEFRKTGPNRCNGLIGVSWMIESLMDAHLWLGSESALKLALDLHGIHPFEARLGLWRSVEADGEVRAVLRTVNQQIWFAAGAARLARHSSAAKSQAESFVDRLDDWFTLEENGRIVHLIERRLTREHEGRRPLGPAFLGAIARRVRRAIVPTRKPPKTARIPDELARNVGYHTFNLLGLSVLEQFMPGHPFWKSEKLSRALAYVETPEYLDGVEGNPYAYPYNPVGFEVALVLSRFAPDSHREVVAWVDRQLERHWDSERNLMCRDTDDPDTLSARLYEALHLPDVRVEAPSPHPATAGTARTARGAPRIARGGGVAS